VIQGQCNIMNN